MRDFYTPQGPALTDSQFLEGAQDDAGPARSAFTGAMHTAFDETMVGTALRTSALPSLARTQINTPGAGRGAVPIYKTDTPEEVQARGDTLFQTPDQYKASPYYREQVPFEKGMTETRAAALSSAYDAKAVRDFYSSKRPLTSFAGGLVGSVPSPENFVPVLGEEALTARIGKVMGETSMMALNAGINTAATQLLTQQQRRMLGDDTSWETLMQNAAFGALTGATIKGLGLGAGAAYRALKPRYTGPKLRDNAGQTITEPGSVPQPTPSDVSEVSVEASPQSQPVPPVHIGGPQEVGAGAGAFESSSEIASRLEAANADRNRLSREMNDAIAAGQLYDTTELDAATDRAQAAERAAQAFRERQAAQSAVPTEQQGLPSVVHSNLRQFLPSELNIDANRFQFKSGGDAAGVTDRLQGVQNWDPVKAGMTLVWQDKEGKYFVADGHQRIGFAKRLEAEGNPPVINGMVIREADGISSEQARAIAAARNIAEGTGNAVDAAKVFRDAPRETLDLPPNSQLVKDAQGLAKLSDDGFRMVVNKKVDPAYAAMVGAMEGNKELHTKVLGILAKVKPSSKIEAESIIRDTQAAPQVQSTMTDLFGTTTETEILYGERAQILASAARTIRNDRAAFNTLISDEDLIEASGNRLNTTRNERRAQQEAMLLANLQAQARRVGPISDALAIAAQKLHGGENHQTVMRDFLRTLRSGKAPKEALEAVQKRADQARMADPAGFAASANLDKLETVQARQEAAQVMNDAMTSLAMDGEVKLSENSQAIIEKQTQAAQDAALGPFKDFDTYYSAAPEWQRQLGEIGRTLEKELPGIRFRDPGLKKRATAEAKMGRKGYNNLQQLVDVVRAGFDLDSPAHAETILAKLREKFNVTDEGWKKTPEGYLDRKMVVTFPDGMKGEMQFWHPDMYKVKESRGHALYEEWRHLPLGDPRRAKLANEMRDLYEGVKLGPDWLEAAKASEGKGGALGNKDLNTVLETTDPLSLTSASSTTTQGAPSESTAQALTASGERKYSAGLHSQLTKNSMEPHVGAEVSGVKPMLLYHGSGAKVIDKFRADKIGSANDEGFYGRGFYFTNNKVLARDYIPIKGGATHEFMVDLKKPFIWDLSNREAEKATIASAKEVMPNVQVTTTGVHFKQRAEWTEALKKAGYDGVIADGGHEVVAFNPEQISKPEAASVHVRQSDVAPRDPQPARFDAPRPEPQLTTEKAKSNISADMKADEDAVQHLIEQAKAEGFDPETGQTDLDGDLMALTAQEVVTPHDLVAMEAARQTLDGAKAWTDVMQVAKDCVLK